MGLSASIFGRFFSKMVFLSISSKVESVLANTESRSNHPETTSVFFLFCCWLDPPGSLLTDIQGYTVYEHVLFPTLSPPHYALLAQSNDHKHHKDIINITIGDRKNNSSTNTLCFRFLCSSFLFAHVISPRPLFLSYFSSSLVSSPFTLQLKAMTTTYHKHPKYSLMIEEAQTLFTSIFSVFCFFFALVISPQYLLLAYFSSSLFTSPSFSLQLKAMATTYHKHPKYSFMIEEAIVAQTPPTSPKHAVSRQNIKHYIERQYPGQLFSKKSPISVPLAKH